MESKLLSTIKKTMQDLVKEKEKVEMHELKYAVKRQVEEVPADFNELAEQARQELGYRKAWEKLSNGCTVKVITS